jgi:hypothetical protein
MRRLPSIALALAAALLPLALGAQGRTRRVDVRRAVTPTVSVRLTGSFALLRVVGWAHDSVVITGTVPADARFESGFGGRAGEPAAGMKAFLELSDRKEPSAPTAELEMRVPERARVWIKAGSASLDVSGVRGGLDLAIVGGSIRVAGAPAELRADAMDGSILVVGTPRWLRAKTASGDIVVRGGSDDVALSTVSGSVRIADGRYERVRLESVAGPMSFAGELARGATLDADTHGGTVTIVQSPKVPVDYDLSSIAGRIENGWGAPSPVAGREGRGTQLAFSTGAGGRVTVRSFKGTVRLIDREGK